MCRCKILNLSLEEERLEVHGGVAHYVHQDGRHVYCHEHAQETSPEDNLGWLWGMYIQYYIVMNTRKTYISDEWEVCECAETHTY